MIQFQNILVAVDSRFDTHPALEWALRLSEHTHAQLKIVDVVPEFSWLKRLAMPDSERTQQVLADEKRQFLETLAVSLRDRGFDVTTRVLFGKTSLEIMHEVQSSNHDLVLRVTKGTHSRRSGFFGTTSMRLLRNCPCAVWLVRADAQPRFSRILAAVDPTPDDSAHEIMNKTIMDLGQSITKYEEGEFHVVHVWELFGTNADESMLLPGRLKETLRKAQMEVAAELENLLLPYNLGLRDDCVHLIRDEGGPVHAIAELAKKQDIDLIVMGTVARTGMAGALMGNTAEKVIDQIECSVLAIKPDNFVSPVALREP